MAVVCFLLQLYLLILLVRIVLSWFPISGEGFMSSVYGLLYSLTEPVLGPLRSILPPVRLGGVALDLSPIVVFLGINILMTALC
ncbi:MAG: YggT family protein [Acidimicrobiales bacterium]|nr:YggT family protein [Acidimicrobiales bacterium]